MIYPHAEATMRTRSASFALLIALCALGCGRRARRDDGPTSAPGPNALAPVVQPLTVPPAQQPAQQPGVPDNNTRLSWAEQRLARLEQGQQGQQAQLQATREELARTRAELAATQQQMRSMQSQARSVRSQIRRRMSEGE